MESIFQTTDFDLAAYLYSRAHAPIEKRTAHGETLFVFPGSAERSVDAFYFGASIPAKSLLHAFHELEHLKEMKL